MTKEQFKKIQAFDNWLRKIKSNFYADKRQVDQAYKKIIQ